MTTEFDLDLERRLTTWLDAVAPAHAPDDLLASSFARTARTRQRPGWLVPERWTPMQLTSRLAIVPRRPLVALLLIALILAVVTALVMTGVGTQLFGPYRPPIAFTSNRDGTKQIYLMNADGTNVRQLTHGAGDASIDDWSPDGSHLLGQGKHGAFEEVFVMNADASGLTWLTSDAHNTGGATWSPDGARIAYNVDTHDNGCYEVFLMDADGSGAQRLTPTEDCNWAPTWTPDGTTILFSTTRDGNFAIWSMDATGANQQRLTAVAARNDAFATVSPDGAKIAFTSWASNLDDATSEVVVMNADGTGRTLLTNNDVQDAYPTWSPGGRIVFLSKRDGKLGLYVANADGSGVSRLTSTSGEDAGVAWR
jgi:Tol biopolymer transport system component